MNIKEVKDLIQEILQSDICDFELEHTGTKVKFRRGNPVEMSHVPSPTRTTVLRSHPPSPQPSEQPRQVGAVTEEPSGEEEFGLHYITSPIVGTFYRAASPDVPPFVNPGQAVDEGTILCIVEAMKLMNEIPADIAGEVVTIFVENARPVEFGQRLFAIRPRK